MIELKEIRSFNLFEHQGRTYSVGTINTENKIRCYNYPNITGQHFMFNCNTLVKKCK